MKLAVDKLVSGKPAGWKTILLSLLLIAGAGLAVYANSLDGRFLFDDDFLVKSNAQIRSWSRVPEIFAGDVGAGAGKQFGFYRPLQILTYLVDYRFWGLNERGYHLTSIILHVLTAWCVFWLIGLLYRDAFLSLLTGLFFVGHPVHTEAISYVSGRADPLAAFFLLLTLIFYLKSVNGRERRFLVPMVLAYALALLSRESSLILPALLLLYHYSFRKRIPHGPLFSLLLLIAAYALLRLTLVREVLSGRVWPTSVVQRLPGFFVALAGYLRLLVLPFGLHMEYGDRLFSFASGPAISGMILFGVLLAAVFLSRNRRAKNPVFFSLGWFLLCLLPFSNLCLLNAYMAEHWLYLPSIGFFLLLSHGLVSGLRNRAGWCPAIIAVFLCLLVFLSILTIRQNEYWREPLSFYERTLRYSPGSYRASYNLGLNLYQRGRKEEAVRAYLQAVKNKPDYADSYNNLGIVYNDLGKGDAAVAAYREAVKINPRFAAAWNNLGVAYKNLSSTEEAIAAYRQAIAINPRFVEAYNNLATVYAAAGKPEEAVSALKRAIESDPGAAVSYYSLGNVYLKSDRNQEAVEQYRLAVARDPDLAEAHNNLGVAAERLNRLEEAVDAYQKAVAASPGYVEAYFNLSEVFRQTGRRKEAIAALEKAIALKPDYAAVHYNLSVLYFYEGRYALAVEHFDRARALGIDVDPGFARELEGYRK